MRVTFPHMGNLWLVVSAALEGMGLEVVVPPPTTQRTLSLGAKHAPEFACLPLKLNLGNYLEAAEKGAEAIIMAGGVGPCRFGYYAQVQREILKDLGLKLEMIVLEPPQAGWKELAGRLALLKGRSWWEVAGGIWLGWQRAVAADAIEQEVQKARAMEAKPGGADAIWRRAVQKLGQAKGRSGVKLVQREAMEALRALPRLRKPSVRLAVVGEIYTVLEPFANHNLERHLGRLGVLVERSLYLSHWVNVNLLGGLLPGGGSTRRAISLAQPYLGYFVGGHGQETVGESIRFAGKGVDGVIQLAPLTCMPEIVAHSVLSKVSEDYGLPVLTIYLDEQAGEAGLVTRLEAFVDLLASRKEKAKSAGGRRCVL